MSSDGLIKILDDYTRIKYQDKLIALFGTRVAAVRINSDVILPRLYRAFDSIFFLHLQQKL